jgi:hypothetical protein
MECESKLDFCGVQFRELSLSKDDFWERTENLVRGKQGRAPIQPISQAVRFGVVIAALE